jgi:hypothetical protein
MCWAGLAGRSLERIELFRRLPAVLRGDARAGLTGLGGDSPSLVTFWVCVVATEVMLIAVCVLATEFLHKANRPRTSPSRSARRYLVSYEIAAHRFINLATMQLGGAGALHEGEPAPASSTKAYANDGVELPSDGSWLGRGAASVPLLDDPTGVRTTRLESAATPEQARRASAELRERMCHRDNYFGEIEMAAADLLAATGYEDGAITRHVVEGWRRTWVFDCCTRRTCRNAPAR